MIFFFRAESQKIRMDGQWTRADSLHGRGAYTPELHTRELPGRANIKSTAAELEKQELCQQPHQSLSTTAKKGFQQRTVRTRVKIQAQAVFNHNGISRAKCQPMQWNDDRN